MSNIEEILWQENKKLREELNELKHDYSEVCKEHSDAILRAAQAEKYSEQLRKDMADMQRNFEVIDNELTEVLDDVDYLSRQVLGHEYEGHQTFEELSRSFDELGEDVVESHREIELLEGEWEAMNEELREMTEKYRQATSMSQSDGYYREHLGGIINDLTEEKRLLHKEIARLNEELAVAIGVKDDDYADEYRKMTVEFAKEHREVWELRGLLSDIHRLSDIEV
jgi:chromosome segregation ATPase